ncbi:MAG: hypothetical protein ACYTGG_04335, partial [Planctomycetota bacterium]
ATTTTATGRSPRREFAPPGCANPDGILRIESEWGAIPGQGQVLPAWTAAGDEAPVMELHELVLQPVLAEAGRMWQLNETG